MKISGPSLFILFLLLIVLLPPLYAQEGEDTPPPEETIPLTPPAPPEETASPKKTTPLEEPAPSKEPEMEGGLLESTLSLDLDTSDYYELLAWCRRLGLDESGSKEDLRLRLYDYYGRQPTESEKPEESGEQEEGDQVEIIQAHALNYFSETNEDQTYIRFTGAVELSFTEEDSKTIHIIKADTLLLNEESKLITAQGNVEYTLKKGEDEDDEVFRGESLAFDVESWSGLFFNGISERAAKKEGKDDIPFYYSGEVIYRSPEDTVILNNGVVTTSNLSDPYVTIRAQKIWVLAPKEWALLHGIFYVGRIPVFYIPGMIKNGDDLFFNPVMGSLEEKGLFYQTTTYLLGSRPEDKEKENSLMDFLLLSEDAGDREIQGLFLKKADGLSPFQTSLRQYAKENDAWIKLMFDGYSNRGLFGGIQGELKNLSVMKKLDFYLGLGLSREVFFENGKYTPLSRNSEGKYESNWEGSFLFGQSLPFRYALKLDTQLSVGPLKSLKLSFPLYSDSSFMVDFADRRENIDWNELFEEESKRDPAKEAKEISSQRWDFTASFDPALKFLSPYISTLKIETLKMNMNWLKKTIPTADRTNSIETFFYPESYYLPELNLRIAGTLLKSDFSSKDKKEQDEALEGLIAPWESWERAGSKTSEDSSEGGIIPEYQDDIDLGTKRNSSGFSWLSQTLSYTLVPKIKLYGSFDSTQWTSPEDINYDIKYRSFTAGDSGTINYKLALFDGVFSIDNKVHGKFGYQERFDRGESLQDDTWEKYRKQDKAASSVKLDDTVSLDLRPLKWWEPMANSRITYSTKFYLYQYQYNTADEDFEDLPFSWDEDGLLSQTITVDTRLNLWDKEQNLKFTATLPPLDQKQSLQSNIKTGPLTSLLTLSRKETKDGVTGETKWQWEPLIWQELFSLDKILTIKQIFNYDIEGNQWQKSRTDFDLYFFDKKLHLSNDFTYNLEEDKPKNLTISLKLWDLTMNFVMGNAEDYTFDFDAGWIKAGDPTFRPIKLNSKLNYSYTSSPLWKNRLKWNISINSTTDMFLQKFTDSYFTFTLTLGLKLFEFIDLKFSSEAENRAIFRYFPSLAETIGVDPINPLTDLLKSFNFFNLDDRQESNFNLNTLSVSLNHDLHDWDLTLEYSGKPVIEDGDEGYKTYKWKNTFSVYVQWKAMRDLETKVSYKDDEFLF